MEDFQYNEHIIGNPDAYDVAQRALRQNAEYAMIDMANTLRQGPQRRARFTLGNVLTSVISLVIVLIALDLLEYVLTH